MRLVVNWGSPILSIICSTVLGLDFYYRKVKRIDGRGCYKYSKKFIFKYVKFCQLQWSPGYLCGIWWNQAVRVLYMLIQRDLKREKKSISFCSMSSVFNSLRWKKGNFLDLERILEQPLQILLFIKQSYKLYRMTFRSDLSKERYIPWRVMGVVPWAPEKKIVVVKNDHHLSTIFACARLV